MGSDVQIAGISGAIELQDKYSEVLNKVWDELKLFGEGTEKVFGAIGVAAGLVAGSFAIIGAAAIELGERGSDINDVATTLDHFSGSATNAAMIMEQMRNGTKGTIDDFVLMKDASKLLSAGVQLNAKDFGDLTSAAFVLQNRGLGTTKEMLDLISSAMVTGRTRALAMKLGVVETAGAEEAYAKSLGITKDQLSEAGKATAKRMEIMTMLRAAVKDAGQQERDFGEQVEAARVFFVNMGDEVAKAVASSPVLAAGMKAVGEAFMEAFGGSTETVVQNVVGFIESAAIGATYFANAMVETARVVHVAWSLIETPIIAVEAAIAGTIAMLPGATEVSRAWANSLKEELAEVTAGITGHSEFDATLDKLGGTIDRVRDAMVKAKESTHGLTEEEKIQKNNADQLAKLQKELTSHMVDRQKVEEALWKVEEKSLQETSALWDKYFTLRTKGRGTSEDYARAQIEATFNKEVSALDATDRNFAEHYKAIRAVADITEKQLSSDWDSVKDSSNEALDQMAKKAENTYTEMLNSGLHFSREVLDAQRQKMIAAQDAARGMGQAWQEAQAKAKAATEATTAALKKETEEAEKAYRLQLLLGASQEVTFQNLKEKVAQTVTGYANNQPQFGLQSGFGGQADALAKQGYSFEQIIYILEHPGQPKPPSPGPRIPGYKAGGEDLPGGPSWVGEDGPEIINIPQGASITPNNRIGGMGGPNISLTFHVNGTAVQAAQQIKNIILHELQSRRQFS